MGSFLKCNKINLYCLKSIKTLRKKLKIEPYEAKNDLEATATQQIIPQEITILNNNITPVQIPTTIILNNGMPNINNNNNNNNDNQINDKVKNEIINLNNQVMNNDIFIHNKNINKNVPDNKKLG